MVNKPKTGRGAGNETVIRGVSYPSQAAAARALGVAETTIQSALERGTIDGAGLGRNYDTKRAVLVDGVRYASIADGARAIGVVRSTLSKYLRTGRQTLNGTAVSYETI